MGLLIGGKALQQLCKSGTNRAEIDKHRVFTAGGEQCECKVSPRFLPWGQGRGAERLSCQSHRATSVAFSLVWLRCTKRPPGWQLCPLHDKADKVLSTEQVSSRADGLMYFSGDWEMFPTELETRWESFLGRQRRTC